MMNAWLDTIWLIPGYSFVGALLSIIWFPSITRNTGPRPAGYINIMMTFFSFLHGIFALGAIWDTPPQNFSVLWFSAGGLDFSIDFYLSPLTIGATVLITGINLLAQIYAVGYLETDWGWARFYALLAFFEAGMCALVLCDSLFFSYIILEMLTLGTYLLVGMWYNQSLVITGARDAFLTKRVGDLFLLVGVVAILPIAGTWNFHALTLWAADAQVNPWVITLVTLGLLAGPMGKCAQFPLHLWLDEAMEGPLPSTILRNAVVVATGAWVLIKLQPVFSLSPFTEATMVTIGAATALGGCLIALAQIDVKRALSYLVSAYMGLVFIAVGTHHSQAALLLILSHALSSALLTMAVGSIITNTITQDLTQMGGLWSRRPISGLCFLAGGVGLVALPPWGGFWPMESLLTALWDERPGLGIVLLLVNGIAACGVGRIFALIWGGKPQQMTYRSAEPLWLIVLPMTFLAGIVLHVPHGLFATGILSQGDALLSSSAMLLLLSTAAGFSLSGVLYLNQRIPKPIVLPWQAMQSFLANDFYTPQLYKMTIVGLVNIASQAIYAFDRFFVDGIGNLFGLVTLLSGQGLKYSTFGQFQLYILTIVGGMGILLLLLLQKHL